MFTAFKAGGILIFFPVIVYMFPDLPQWIGRLGPSYYFLDPIFDAVAGGAGLGDVWFRPRHRGLDRGRTGPAGRPHGSAPRAHDGNVRVSRAFCRM